MNLIDVTIIKILEEPKQIINDDLCCWQIKVLTDCYGRKTEKVFRSTSKGGLEKYKIGFSWME